MRLRCITPVEGWATMLSVGRSGGLGRVKGGTTIAIDDDNDDQLRGGFFGRGKGGCSLCLTTRSPLGCRTRWPRMATGTA